MAYFSSFIFLFIKCGIVTFKFWNNSTFTQKDEKHRKKKNLTWNRSLLCTYHRFYYPIPEFNTLHRNNSVSQFDFYMFFFLFLSSFCLSSSSIYCEITIFIIFFVSLPDNKLRNNIYSYSINYLHCVCV